MQKVARQTHKLFLHADPTTSDLAVGLHCVRPEPFLLSANRLRWLIFNDNEDLPRLARMKGFPNGGHPKTRLRCVRRVRRRWFDTADT